MTEETRHIIRKIGMKFLLLAMVLVVLDLVYRFTLYPKDREKYCTLLTYSRIPVQDSTDIIYLGESSNHSCSPLDEDQRAISEMLGGLMPGHRVGKMSKDACHAGIFYDMLRNIPRKSPVKTVVVTVNMRSFSSEWIYADLERPLQKEQIMMKKAPSLYKRMLLAFKAYAHWSDSERDKLVREGLKKQTLHLPYYFPYKSASDWDHAIGTQCYLYNGEKVSMDTVALTCHYIKDFAYHLDDGNPRIRDLDKIVRLCHRRGWNLVFHIMSDNMDQIRTLAGPDLEFLMKSNAQYIIRRYEPKGVAVVNNQYLVRDRDFFERGFPTEHYTQHGRMASAERIAERLKEEGWCAQN